MHHAKISLFALIVMLSACHRDLLRPTPPTESELEMRAALDTIPVLQKCAVDYAKVHWKSNMTGTELAKAAVFSCNSISIEIYTHELKSYMKSEDFTPRLIDGTNFALAAQKTAEDGAQSAVLKAVAEDPR